MELTVQADVGYTPLRLQQDEPPFAPPSIGEKIEKWRDKEMHGRFPGLIDERNVDLQASLRWLLHKDLYPETEGFIFAIQDRVMKTRNYQ